MWYALFNGWYGFQIKEIDFGMVAEEWTLQRLLKLIPHGIVMEWAFMGRFFLVKKH